PQAPCGCQGALRPHAPGDGRHREESGPVITGAVVEPGEPGALERGGRYLVAVIIGPTTEAASEREALLFDRALGEATHDGVRRPALEPGHDRTVHDGIPEAPDRGERAEAVGVEVNDLEVPVALDAPLHACAPAVAGVQHGDELAVRVPAGEALSLVDAQRRPEPVGA